MTVPPIRVTELNDTPVRAEGEFVVYWMIAQRRTQWNFALQYAAHCARLLHRPLVIFEALRAGYRWNSRRIHAFVVQGMRDNAAACAAAGVPYLPYVEPQHGAGRGLLGALADRACMVITDEFPCFFLPRMLRSVAGRLPVRLEQVDGNGLLPLRAADRAYTTAASFRRHLQKTLPAHLDHFPAEAPLAEAGGSVDLTDIRQRWPTDLASPDLLDIPFDHDVPEAPIRGGRVAGTERMHGFFASRLARYGDRNHPAADAASGLSPYLHFGHVSTHEIVAEVFAGEDWHPGKLAGKATGSRRGWWGMSETAEGFLDELITWRELGYGFCFHRPDDFDSYSALPEWAKTTLAQHVGDPREYVYDFDTFDRAQTHDPVWNAAQNQLRREGTMHNYLRMLWGKKVLEWTERPTDALQILIELNNRYALDGRNPNSYSGILWIFGRFDRAWGPERPIYGKIRYMTSQSTLRKLRMGDYLTRYA